MMDSSVPLDRGQVGIGTLVVFIAMIIVATIAVGVLLEVAGGLSGQSEETGQQASSGVTDRVLITGATATYSGGDMASIDIDVRKGSGSGDIDLSSAVIHWVGPNGSSELTSSTFSITAVRGSGTVLTDRSDMMTLSNFGKTLPAGDPATVRIVTADGGVTTAIIRAPNAPPTDGAAPLLRGSPGGNPGGGGSSTAATTVSTVTTSPGMTTVP